MKLTGKTITFTNPIYVKSWASAVGSKETAGPLKNHFDLTFDDDLLGQPTWEKAETQLVRSAVKTALDKGGVTLPQLDFMTGGDLLNQCTASSSGFMAPAPPWRKDFSFHRYSLTAV